VKAEAIGRREVKEICQRLVRYQVPVKRHLLLRDVLVKVPYELSLSQRDASWKAFWTYSMNPSILGQGLKTSARSSY